MARRSSPYRNPFFVLLVLAGVLFVVTALGYLISPTALEQARRDGAPRGPALARYLDACGPTMLGAELVVMLGAGIGAMATDPLFARRSER